MTETNEKFNPLKLVHETLERLDKVQQGETFKFRCHKGVDCWGSCCKTANIFLTPYDVLRLKGALGMDSSEFLERHTTLTVGEDFGLPIVRLDMRENGHCPFLDDSGGCSVYGDRPTSCRSYPIGQATSSGVHNNRGEMVFFKIEEDHCHGWLEDKEWGLDGWFDDQGVMEYNAANEFSVYLAFSPRLGEVGRLDDKKLGMILMALYDIDKFRKFVFETSFLDKFDVDAETVEKIKTDDSAALRFGMRWIEFSVLGAPAIEIRDEGAGGA